MRGRFLYATYRLNGIIHCFIMNFQTAAFRYVLDLEIQLALSDGIHNRANDVRKVFAPIDLNRRHARL